MHSHVVGGGSGAVVQFGGAAAGKGPLLLGAVSGGERVKRLLDAAGREVALAEISDLG